MNLKHYGLKFVSSRYRKICFKEEEVYYVEGVKEGVRSTAAAG